jgi:hypothetical protein
MTTEPDADALASGLQDLAGGITPDHRAGIARARRTIARRARNRRIMVGGIAAIAVIAVGTTALALAGRSPDHSARPLDQNPQPIVTSEPSSTSVTTTTTAPTTTSTLSGTIVPSGGIFRITPIQPDTPSATPVYTQDFPWGRGPGQVAFSVPKGEGASGGPAAFTATADGTVALFDQSNARIVTRSASNPASSLPLGLVSGVTAATFDARGRLIVALYNDLAVYGPDGTKQAAFPGPGPSGTEITRLVVYGATVYSVAPDLSLTAVLRDDGTGYSPTHDAALEAAALTITIEPGHHVAGIAVAGGGRQYGIGGPDALLIRDVPAARLLPDGSLVFAMGFYEGASPPPDQPEIYIVGRIHSGDHMRFDVVRPSAGYLVNGPEFVLDNDGYAVLGSTIASGATVSYYRYPDL